MSCLTVVLCNDGLPPLGESNERLSAAGLDVVVHPFPPVMDDGQAIFVEMNGQITGLDYEGAPIEAKETWFPDGRFLMPKAKGVIKISWWDTDWLSEAAAWAIAAALAQESSAIASLSSGRVFDDPGINGMHGKSAELAYTRARELIAELPATPTPKRIDPEHDHRSEFARRYDETTDFEGGDEESTDRLLAATFRAFDAQKRAGVKQSPPDLSGKSWEV